MILLLSSGKRYVTEFSQGVTDLIKIVHNFWYKNPLTHLNSLIKQVLLEKGEIYDYYVLSPTVSDRHNFQFPHYSLEAAVLN